MVTLTSAGNYVFGAALVGLVVCAIVSDARRLTIPNWISICLIVAFIIYVPLAGRQLPIVLHILVGLVAFAIGLAFFIIGWFGGGDVKFLAAVALWAGPEKIAHLTFIMSLVGAALSVAILMMRGWLARYPDLPARSPFAAIASWARQGVCPYGIAIGLGALATLPARFY